MLKLMFIEKPSITRITHDNVLVSIFIVSLHKNRVDKCIPMLVYGRKTKVESHDLAIVGSGDDEGGNIDYGREMNKK